ncbi:MAG: CO dehydrogenase/acetyl-CoA synthase subunit delta [Candidatus Bathyarchaeota archaeon]|nr:CO dehydrogenase/acetyl-CoA synthase subunit delta [Candidatus Bathyarchaeota archaeon]MDH5786945.1 CO dehydrogenase/acetyl-CoA synthase subunit delta [Candidatus Bathyarchaeota archaeon]
MAEKEKGEKALGLKLSADLVELLAKLQEIELEDFEMNVGDLEIWFQPGAIAAPKIASPKIVSPVTVKPTSIIAAEFVPPIETYPGKVVEVKLGATKSGGGTRGKSVIIGGETTPAFYTFESPALHPPVVTLDVFDMEVPLAKAVKMHVKEVLGDPAAWAKLAVEKFGADLVTIHLISIDPLVKDASPKEAVKTVEEVAQAVDVPLVIGGCGDPVKDANMFAEVAKTFAGERFLISSITRDMDVERCAKFIKKNGHVALSFTPMDLNLARELNRRLYDFLPKEDIVMDLTTAALGYGLDYAFTNMERARLAGLMGDPELAHPMSSGTTNAWAAREAWLKMAPEWEPRELRGPLWEVVTALTLLLAGVDLFMMMHPAAVKTLKDITRQLTAGGSGDADKLVEWVSMKI